MKKYNKKGISRLLFLILMIVFVLIAVAIIWIVVKTLIDKSSEQITLKGLNTGLNWILIN